MAQKQTEYQRDVEALAMHYRGARDRLADRLHRLEAEVDTLRQAAIHDLRRLVADVAQVQSELSSAIADAPEEWVKPRTRVYHAVKIGLRARPAKLTITDKVRTVELIRERLPDAAEVLIRVKPEPVMSAIKELDKETLTSIGIHVTPPTDEVVISDALTELEALLNALLGDALSDEDGGAA
jgi:hypothetical protein